MAFHAVSRAPLAAPGHDGHGHEAAGAQPTGPRRLAELTPAALADVLRADPRLLLPVGTLAPHGPHLPLGADTLIVDRLADDLSARCGVLRAPTVPYGANPVAPAALLGATSLRKKTLHRLLNDLLSEWELHGVREFVLLTAHRHDPHLEALATVITARARVRVVDALSIECHDLLEGQDEAMHADEVDTSLLLYLAPDLVRNGPVPDNMVPRATLRLFRAGRAPDDGLAPLGRPSLASPEKGARLYARILDRIAERVLGAPPAAT